VRLAVLAVAALLGAPQGAGAADRFAYRMVMTPEEGPVDKAVEARYTDALHACQEHAVVTDDNARCFLEEFPRQDARLNAAWRATFARMGMVDKPALLAAQRKWIEARDPFCRKVADEFKGGTILPVIWHNCRAEQTIRRAMWLEKLGR